MNIKLRYFQTDAVFQTIPEVYENISFIQETEQLRTHNHTYQFVTPEFNQAVLDDIEDLADYKEQVSERFDDLEQVIDDSSKVVAASLNDLNTRLSDLQSDYESVKQELFQTIEDNDLVYTSALNDLNSRIIALNEGLEEANNANDELAQVIEDNELVIAEALNDLNSRTEVLEHDIVTATEFLNKNYNQAYSELQLNKLYYDQTNQCVLMQVSRDPEFAYSVIEFKKDGIYLHDKNEGGDPINKQMFPTWDQYQSLVLKNRNDLLSSYPSELASDLDGVTLPVVFRTNSGLIAISATTSGNVTTYKECIVDSTGITIREGSGNEWDYLPTTAYQLINKGTSDTTFTILPNRKYVWGEVASLTITLGQEIAGVVNTYYFQFDSGNTATTLTLPSTIKWNYDEQLEILPNTRYQINIEGGIATVGMASL